MKFFSNKKAIQFRQKVAFVLAVIMFAEAAVPTVTFALTSGPSAPEFSSFEPVTTTSMVNEFSGDFTYNIPVINIPGANGGGYAMSLSYHAGEGVESESSWVGYGWTLNAGSINRGKKGFADDTKNERVYYNDVPANWTISTGVSVGDIEAFSFQIPLSANASIRYNNYKGFGYTAGVGLSFRQGLVSLGYSVSDGSGSFSAQVNPAAALSSAKKKKDVQDKANKYREAKTSKDKDAALAAYNSARATTKKERRASKALGALGSIGSNYGMSTLGDQQHPTTVTSYEGRSFNTTFSLQINPGPAEVGAQVGFYGNFNWQKNTASASKTATGYLYSHDAYANENSLMDYSVEKESMYNKRDRYLSIPFSSADQFSVTGEGVGGGFRLYNRKVGYFRPNAETSNTTIFQVAGDVSVGLEYGGGFNVGGGLQQLKVNGDDWGTTSNTRSDYKFDETLDDAYFFRFNGDLGGDVSYGENTKAEAATLNQINGTIGAKVFNPNLTITNSLSSTIPLSDENTVNRSGRSSYIAYHKNNEMVNNAYAYERSADVVYKKNGNEHVPAAINRTKAEQIGEIATVNEDGNTYVYGLPVRVANEKNMQYDLQGVAAANIYNNFLAYKDTDQKNEMKIGEEEKGAYASSYLLTQIVTPDYIDRTLNGPTADDFGGYTKFEYEQLYTADIYDPLYPNNDKGFHYRMPYTGLNYSKGELSNPTDDMGSFSSGDKDVFYLRRIVTKTHIAKFITEDRLDGIEAASDATADNDKDAKGSKQLKRLKAIELYAVNEDGSEGKLIKKVLFGYDYSLCKEIPNGLVDQATGKTGKLTLKKVWFEYEGIVNAKISPYTFEYKYPKAAGGRVYPDANPDENGSKNTYKNFQAEYANLNENPIYSPFAIDAWGNYQDATTGQQRFSLMKNTVNQKPPEDFDPAAWQLKVIKLPSGGEIHVQYEQDDYLYVQNRRATALVSLLPEGANSYINDLGKSTFILNTDDINVKPDELPAMVNLLNQELKGDKIAFKFLYALIGKNPEIGQCNADYVDGYVNFLNASIVNNKIQIQVGSASNEEYSLPREICLDLVKKQKAGKLSENGGCNASDTGVITAKEGSSAKDVVMQLKNFIGTSFFAKEKACLQLKPELSYFKIPVLHAKKGGGLRIKRLLMYDKNGIDYADGVNAGIPALYGTEYIYETEDGNSSGVATNEPATIRDENALVTFLPKRKEQSFLNKAIAGVDKEQFEGPIGETLLPAPSVGYSRVITKNIHNGKTNTGFIVNEFNTVKDYPFDREYIINGEKVNGITYTDLVDNGAHSQKDNKTVPAIIFNLSVSNVWSTQGYAFILNAMHGQPKSVSTYSGKYTEGSLKLYSPSSATVYSYYDPGEKIKLMKPNGTVVDGNPGKEMEVILEMKQVTDITVEGNLEIDFGVGVMVPPIPQASASGSGSYTESKMRTHVTTKVIQYPAIQKSVTTVQDGITHTTENQVFSAYTGKPVITKTTDGYDGLALSGNPAHKGFYTSHTTPASFVYPEMSQKAINEKYTIKNESASGGLGIQVRAIDGHYYLEFSNPPGSLCDVTKALTKGDLIKVSSIRNTFYFHIGASKGNSIELFPAKSINNNVETELTGETNFSTVEVLKSGRTNQLNAIAGNYTTYGESTENEVQNTSADLSARQAFAALLNDKLTNGGVISASAIPAGLKVSSWGNPCATLLGPIQVSVTEETITIKQKTGQDPAVGFLNDMMDHFWRKQIPAGANASYTSPTIFPCVSEMAEYKWYASIPSLQEEMNAYIDNAGNGIFSGIVGGAKTLQLTPYNTNYFPSGKISSIKNHTTTTCPTLTNSASESHKLTSIGLFYGGEPIKIGGHFNLGANGTSFLAFYDYFGSNSKMLVPQISCSSAVNSMLTGKYSETVGKFGQNKQGYLTYTCLVDCDFYGDVSKTDGKTITNEYYNDVVVFDNDVNADLPTIQFEGLYSDDPTDDICESVLKKSGGNGHFEISEQTGQLEYFTGDNACSAQSLCFQFCPDMSSSYYEVTNVISSSATTFDDEWYDITASAGTVSAGIGKDGGVNVYESGEKGKWRPKSTYVYNTSNVESGNGTNKKNYNAGTYTMRKFNWKSPFANDTWTLTNTVTKYSENGAALEEKDALNIYSCSKYGYKGRLPYLVAQNCTYNSVMFESFENKYGNTAEESLPINPSQVVTDVAHSGKSSYKLSSNSASGLVGLNIPMVFTSQLKKSGLSIKVWVKTSALAGTTETPIKGHIPLSRGALPIVFAKVAKTGEWTLYEASLKNLGTYLSEGKSFTTVISSNMPSTNVWIDDIRQQPLDAQMNAYVYDKTTFRLLASFDDQNFGLYYQYNAEGKLVRKLIETERGMKTITETQYHTALKTGITRDIVDEADDTPPDNND